MGRPWGLVGILPNNKAYPVLTQLFPDDSVVAFWRSTQNARNAHTRADLTAHGEMWLRRVLRGSRATAPRCAVGVFFHLPPLALDLKKGTEIFTAHGATEITELTNARDMAGIIAAKEKG